MFYIVLLIVLGILFLVAEMLILSGSFIGTMLALICYGSAIYLTYDAYGTTGVWIAVAVIIVLSLVATVLSLRAKTWQRLSLNHEINSTSQMRPQDKIAVGATGTAMSRLAPMGNVVIDGALYEAKTTGVFLDQNTQIEVIGFDNFTVIVRPKE